MVGIALGGLLGALAGLIALAVSFAISGEVRYEYEHIPIKIGSVLMVVCTILGVVLGGNFEKHSYQSYIEEYKITKEVIETSLTNENLTGFERVELVKQAVDANKLLVNRQYDAKQWYGLSIPDEILELEPIRFGDGNG